MFHRFRSSYRRCFVKKGVLRNFAKLTGNICARVSFLKKLQTCTERYRIQSECGKMQVYNFIKKESLVQVFSCEFANFPRTPFLQKTSGQLLLSFLLVFFQNLEKTVEENNKLLMEVRPFTFSKILLMSVQYVNKLTKTYVTHY